MADALALTGTAASFEFARQDGLPPVPSQGFVQGLVGSQTEPAIATASAITGWKRADAMSPENRDQKWSNWLDLDGLAAFLRAQHPDKTAEHVAALTDTPVHTVRKWLARLARPGCAAILRLLCVYGPDVLAAMFRVRPRWLDAAVRAADQDRAELRVAYVKSKIRGAS